MSIGLAAHYFADQTIAIVDCASELGMELMRIAEPLYGSGWGGLFHFLRFSRPHLLLHDNNKSVFRLLSIL